MQPYLLSQSKSILAPSLLFVLAVILLNLTGCVTVTESRFTAKASPEQSVENYTQLGMGYLQRGRVDWARERLQRALKIDEDYAPANDAMGLVWQSESEFDLAEEYFLKAIKSDDEFTLAKHHLGRLYAQLNRREEAERYLKLATENRFYDKRPGAFNDLALNYFRAGNPPAAIASYRETLRLSPYNVDALVNISTLYFEQADYTNSTKYYERFHRMVERNQTKHTAHSLWLGVQLATINQKTERSMQLAMQLKQQFPNSNEYKLYQESLNGASR